MLGGESAISQSYSAVSSLSNYTNFCYPTQLCLNSEANIIPYVGYFNEGLYAEASNSGLDAPLYEHTLSGIPRVLTADENKSTYCADIYERYAEYVNDDKALSEQYSREHILEDIMQTGSFRLGPNNKSTYLFGGIFGLNNGYCRNIGYAGKFIFDNNFVGIVGGIAGRQARGSIKNAYSMPEFSFTSAAFNDIVTIQSNEDTIIESIDCDGVNPRLLLPTLPVSVPATQCYLYSKAEKDSAEVNVSSLSGCTIINASNDNVRAYFHNLEYITDISATSPIYTIFDVDVTSARVFKLDGVDRIYDNDKLANVTLECSSFSSILSDESSTAVSYISKLQFYNCYATYVQSQNEDVSHTLYPWVSNTDEFVKINDSLHNIKLVNSTSYVNVTIVTPLTELASAVSNVALPISATIIDESVYNGFRCLNEFELPKLTVTATSAIDVKLAPIVHAGGFCGEYIVTDTVEKSFSSIDAQKRDVEEVVDFDNIKLNNVCSQIALTTSLPDNATDRQYNSYNTIASFAADISLDTMNKSNCDTLSAYPYTSANAQRVTRFKDVFCNLPEDKIDSSWNKLVTSSDFVRYFNYVPDAMPAVIVSEPRGKTHSKSHTYEPNFGLTWLDQLFFNGNAYAHKTGELTDAFINTPAQAKMSSAVDMTVISAWLHHRQLYDTYFEFEYDNDVKTSHSAHIASYVTRQSDVFLEDTKNLIDAPYQYTQGRIGYSPQFVSQNEGYSYSTSDKRPYYLPTDAIICSASSDENVDASAKVADLIKDIDSTKHNYTPAYVYTYSSDVVADALPVVPFTMSYTDEYLIATSKDIRWATALGGAYVVSASKNKAYAMSSDSYSGIYTANENVYSTLPQFEQDGDPLSANSLVFGYIPGSADILYCLNQSIVGGLSCSGLSANDLQYMLVIDDARRIIFDTKLDITAADNDGYIVKFPEIRAFNGIRLYDYYVLGSLSGLAINIATSNN